VNFFEAISSANSSLKVVTKETMLELGLKNRFPTKEFLIAGKIVHKTPILNFFESISSFQSFPIEKIQFTCKACHKEIFVDLKAVILHFL
jgi:hypothetical protein